MATMNRVYYSTLKATHSNYTRTSFSFSFLFHIISSLVSHCFWLMHNVWILDLLWIVCDSQYACCCNLWIWTRYQTSHRVLGGYSSEDLAKYQRTHLRCWIVWEALSLLKCIWQDHDLKHTHRLVHMECTCEGKCKVCRCWLHFIKNRF